MVVYFLLKMIATRGIPTSRIQNMTVTMPAKELMCAMCNIAGKKRELLACATNIMFAMTVGEEDEFTKRYKDY